MAKLIPSGVINLPNFAELQYKLNEQERQKQLQFDEWSSQFQKKAGTYLDGDREAVQQSYDQVEKALTDLATDPDNLELRRKVREANAAYNQVAGTAQFLADNYRQQWSAYNTNPDQFSLGGESAVDVFNRERTTKRDANQIMSMASNPFTLQPKYKYDMESPVQVADQALQFISRNIKDFILENGRIDRDKVEQYANRYYDSRYIDPNQKRNAVVYEGVSQGIIGRNGEITSKSDLDILNTEEFAPEAKNLELNFKDKFVDAVMTGAQEVGVDAYTRSQDRFKRGIELAKLNRDKQDITKNNPYYTMKPEELYLAGRSATGKATKGLGKGFQYSFAYKPIKTATDEIIGFGSFNGEPYYTRAVETQVPINGVLTKTTTPQTKPMTKEVEGAIRMAMGDELFESKMNDISPVVVSTSSQNAVSSQQPTGDDATINTGKYNQ